jgi:hypothetical protein
MPSRVYRSRNNRFARRGPRRDVIHVIGPGISYVPLTKGLFALIEAEDAPLLEEIKWQPLFTKDGGKHSVQGYTQNRAFVLMHRLLMSAEKDQQVDHRNCNPFDNRRHGNLRFASSSQNMANAKVGKNKAAAGRLKGVTFKQGKYQARAMKNGKSYSAGYYFTEAAAHVAYCELATRLHGEFARSG